MAEKTLHYAHPTGLALELTAGAVYILCALFFIFLPVQTVDFFNSWRLYNKCVAHCRKRGWI